ncbi:unannotated protein [freshwater metagenome]|uniref:Unannotated protein n=1 Tax=freshwater metagenome TaxID=449393 RepID=A0A6J7NTL5_9ZZZZ
MDTDAPTTDWHPRAAALALDPRPVINGLRVAVMADDAFASVNPATGRSLLEVPAGGAADVDSAVSAARAAFEGGAWSLCKPRDRARLLLAFADALELHTDELGLLDSLEMGMPVEGARGDIAVAATGMRWYAEACDKFVDGVLPPAAASLTLNVRVPRGVVGAIVPWNFPAFNALSKIGPALASGNTMVLKPSELASLSALRIADIALEAGIPAGVLNVVPGLGAVAGEALAGHHDVDYLTFTGSTRVGRRLMELSAASNLKPLALELGGKSPQVVLASARNLEAIADSVASTIFWNSGQVCTAGSRLIVHESHAEELVALVSQRAAAISVGDPLDRDTTHGPLASATQLERVVSIVSESVAQGARVVVGGTRSASLPEGFGYDATLLADESADSPSRQEIFGPVLSVVRFSDDDDAVRLANDTEYGLMSYVWAGDAGEGYRLASRLRCGGANVNPSPESPPEILGAGFEPARASGFGAENGVAGLQGYTRLRTITLGL